MRRGFSSSAPITRTLIALCLGGFLLQNLFGAAANEFAEVVFGLSARGLAAGGWWQPVTYQFLHGNFLHLSMNLIGLWFAGREVEFNFGPARYLVTYFAGGILGGLLQVALGPNPDVPLIGASASVCAVFLAFSAIYANVPVTALLFFVVPVELKAKYLGYLLIGSSLLLGLTGWLPGVGHYAHLGGALTGWAAAGCFGRSRGFFPRFSGGRRRPVEAGNLTGLSPEGPGLNGVLNKILRQGLHSLSPEEMETLKRYRRKPRR